MKFIMIRYVFLVLPLILMGCETNTKSLDFAYAKPNNLGMFDPQATPAGTFYSWNTETNRLAQLGELKLLPGTPSAPRSVLRNRVAGLGVDGLPLNDVKIVEAKIGGQIKTDVKDTVRQKYFNTKTALSAFVKAQKTQNGASEADILDTFRPKDQRYRVVVFNLEERSGEVNFRFGAREENGSSVANFKVQLGSQEVVAIKVDALSEESCGRPTGAQSARPICFSDVIVYDPFIQENGLIGWRRDDNYNQSDLSAALRGS